MDRTNPNVDDYLATGCGRCPKWNTADCKINDWREEIIKLRALLLESDLTEDRKWGQPVYTLNDKNVVMIYIFKDTCGLSFFKGVLMSDPQKLLIQRTPNMQVDRELQFTSIEQIKAIEETIRAYIQEATEIERKGLQPTLKKTKDYNVPEELLAKFEEDPAFEAAFEALTPGRQRGYLLHFGGAKQSATRTRRIEKATADIFAGKGRHDR
jgi:uncharacterized protein YdeI (YjbR/CyaY-like superfamily)